MTMGDAFTPYEQGLRELRRRLGAGHARLQTFLNYEHRLQANVRWVQEYGETPTLRAERNQIVDRLNALALETCGRSFNEMSGLAPDETTLTAAPRGTSLPVVSLLNLPIVGVLAALVWPSLLPLLSLLMPWLPCIPAPASALSLALILLALFHLLWRHRHAAFITSSGELGLLGITVPIRELALLVDILHPWRLSDAWLRIVAVVLALAAAILGLSPLSPVPPPPEQTPVVREFSVQFLRRGGGATALATGGRVELAPGEQVLVRAETLGGDSALCRWSVAGGGLEPAEGCATLYSAPLAQGYDVLNVSAQSPCRTRSACASLHISIQNP